MIKRLNQKNRADIVEFIKKGFDKFEDFYITHDRKRLFLTDSKLVEKLLKKQEIYGLYDSDLKGLLMIFREKNFRPYIKILSSNKESNKKLITFLIYNFAEQDLYCKFKKLNPLTEIIQKYGFIFQGDRGQEILLFRKGIKSKIKQENKNGFDNN
jgi:hypothetical protein